VSHLTFGVALGGFGEMVVDYAQSNGVRLINPSPVRALSARESLCCFAGVVSAARCVVLLCVEEGCVVVALVGEVEVWWIVHMVGVIADVTHGFGRKVY
jgi:hypothetical protein